MVKAFIGNKIKISIMVTIAALLLLASAAYAASSSTAFAKLYWGNNKYYVFNNSWGSSSAGSGWWESIYYNNDTDRDGLGIGKRPILTMSKHIHPSYRAGIGRTGIQRVADYLHESGITRVSTLP